MKKQNMHNRKGAGWHDHGHSIALTTQYKFSNLLHLLQLVSSIKYLVTCNRLMKKVIELQ